MGGVLEQMSVRVNNVYPCLDEMRRYRSFPCSQCTAIGCIFGKKPKVRVELAAGQKRCALEECNQPFTPGPGVQQKTEYCCPQHRAKQKAKRRRERRLGGDGAQYAGRY